MPSFTRINDYVEEGAQSQNVNNEKKERQENMSRAYDKMMEERTQEMNSSITGMRQ